MRTTYLIRAALTSTLFLSPLSFADTISTTTSGTITTSSAITNSWEITPAGQVTADSKDAMQITTTNGGLLVDANNINTNAAIQTTTSGNGITITKESGTITLGANSGITAATDGILIDSSKATVVNSGTILGGQSAVELTANAAAIQFTNNAGALIANNGTNTAAVFLVDSGNSALTLTNNGTILSSVTTNDTVQVDSPFTTFTNGSTGVIAQSVGGVNTGNAVTVGPSSAVLAGNFINNGMMSVAGAGMGFVVTANNTFPTVLTFTNNGTLTTNTGDAVEVLGNIASINNTGSITSNNPTNATLYAADASMHDGVTNSGNILNFTAGNDAINFQGGSNTAAITLNQNDGVIGGNVLLASQRSDGASAVFNMSGGTIAGNVIAANANPNTLNLNGGTITGNVVTGNALVDEVNLAGTSVLGTINGQTTAEAKITGGSFGMLQSFSEVDVNASFTANGPMDDVGILQTNNAGTVFTLNQPLTNLHVFALVSADTTMIDNANISGDASFFFVSGNLQVEQTPIMDFSASPLEGSLMNVGTVTLGSDAILTVKNTSTASPFINSTLGGTGNLVIAITPTSAGQLVGNSPGGSIDLASGSFLTPTISGFIPAGSTYDVVVATGGANINNNATLVQPSSAIVRFTPTLLNGNTILRLTSSRNSYSSFVSSDLTQGIAGTLDDLAQGAGPSNADLLFLIEQLDAEASSQALLNDFESLLPPYNYGLVEGAHFGMNMVFNGLDARLSDLHWYPSGRGLNKSKRNRSAPRGMNYGDQADHYGLWIRGLGGYADQDDRDSAPGYQLKGVGGALGVDWGVDCAAIGLAASWTHVDVEGKELAPRDQEIRSYQATLYGWYAPLSAVFVEGMIGLAHQDIDANRIIQVNSFTTAAQASYDGTAFGTQIDVGYDFMHHTNTIAAPFVRLKYSHLDLDEYSEYGAGGLDLTVASQDLDEFAGGVGFRWAAALPYEQVVYEPALSAVLLYDFQVDDQDSMANFEGGGIAFATPGVKPGRTIFDLGLGLDTHFTPASCIAVKYDLELRERFISHSGYVQYYYRWG